MQHNRYFIYARKSTDGEDRQVTSIADQLSEAQKLATQLGLEVVDIISESKSAKAPGREQFNLMLKRIQKGEANGIISWKLNRLARNPQDAGYIISLLQTGQIQHIQTHGRSYLPSDNVLMMYIEFGMANQFVNDLSLDIRRGMNSKAERGWLPVTTLALGYIHNPQRNENRNAPEIIIDKKNFKIVRHLWDKMLTEEYNVLTLKKLGDKLGLKTKKGNPVATSSYYRLFRNQFYCGYFNWKDKDGVMQRVKGKHKPMITEKEFNKVQQFLEKKCINKKTTTYSHNYSGLFSCGECGCSITAEVKNTAYCLSCKYKFSVKKKNQCPKCNISISKKKQFSFFNKTYYRCTKKKRTCSQKYMTAEDINLQINSLLENITINNDFYTWAMQIINELKFDNDSHKFTQELKKKLSSAINQLKKYTEMRANSELNATEFFEIKKEIIEKKEALEKELNLLHEGSKKWKNIAQNLFNFALRINDSYKKANNSDRKKIIRQLGSNPTLLGKKLYFTTPKLLLGLPNCERVYTKEKSRLEPNKPLIELGDLGGSDPAFSALWAELQSARESILSGTLNFDYDK